MSTGAKTLSPATVASAVVLGGAIAWAYADVIAMLAGRWWDEEEYHHGFLVPAFSLYLLWVRREMFKPLPQGGNWWAAAAFGVAGALRWASAYWTFELLDPLSILPCMAGVALAAGGWKALRWSWPAILFLGFMVPLPGRLADVLSGPLQRIGTVISTYILQTLGVPSVAQGNVILMTEGQVGVAEACSGLRMMVLFFAVCTGAALLMSRGTLERVVVVLSAAPIAVAANVVRITATALLHESSAWHGLSERTIHDAAGWFMMPLAVIMLWLEVALLSRLILIPPDDERTAVAASLALEPQDAAPGRAGP